jgi:hypothetical protein
LSVLVLSLSQTKMIRFRLAVLPRSTGKARRVVVVVGQETHSASLGLREDLAVVVVALTLNQQTFPVEQETRHRQRHLKAIAEGPVLMAAGMPLAVAGAVQVALDQPQHQG